MGVALIVSGKDTAKLSLLLNELGIERFAAAATGQAARALMRENEFDFIMINAPLSDESGVELAKYAAESCLAGILLIVSAGRASPVRAKVESAGVWVLSKPMDEDEFKKAVYLLSATRRRYASLMSENKELRIRLDELKVVSRAKALLVASLDMTEAQAHRYIEKQAMDMRVTRREIAEGIIKTYDG